MISKDLSISPPLDVLQVNLPSNNLSVGPPLDVLHLEDEGALGLIELVDHLLQLSQLGSHASCSSTLTRIKQFEVSVYRQIISL